MAASFDVGDSKVVRRDVFLVDPTEIILSDDDNTRAFPVSDEAIDEMVGLFRKQTQLQPILCRRMPDKRLKVVFGFRRLKAALKLHAENPEWMVKVSVDTSMNELDALLASIGENFRVATNPVDHSKNIHNLMENFGWTVDQVAEFYKWNRTKVSEVRKVKGLPVRIQRALAAGKIALAPALMMGHLDAATIEEMLTEKGSPLGPETSPEPIETDPDGNPLQQTLFPAVASVATHAGSPEGSPLGPEAVQEPAPGPAASKAKRGRPAKNATKPVKAATKPAKVKASAVAAKLRDSGTVVKRGLVDLRKVLDGREDPVSLALMAYLAGTGTEEALTEALNDAEPVMPAETVFDPASPVTEYDPSEGERAVWGVMAGVAGPDSLDI